MKKALSFVFALIIILCANLPLMTAVFADETVEAYDGEISAVIALTSGRHTLVQGMISEYTVSVEGTLVFNALSIEPVFDHDAFELVNGEWIRDGAVIYDFNMEDGVGVIAWGDTVDVGGSVFTFRLRALSYTESTEIGAAIKYQVLKDDDSVALRKINAAPVTVKVEPASARQCDISYEWANDNSSCTAIAVYQDDGETVTETVRSEYKEIAPGCVAGGSGTYTATFENPLFEARTKDVSIPAAGHKLTYREASDATHFEDGNIGYYTCGVCGKYFADPNGKNEIPGSDTTVPKIAHTYGEWTVTREATAAEDGERVRICTVCGYEDKQKMEKDDSDGSGGFALAASIAAIAAVILIGAAETVYETVKRKRPND